MRSPRCTSSSRWKARCVEEAGGGAEALDKARAQPFDVIVSDLAMPGMDGMSLLRQIRAMPGFANAAAIACSGFNRRQDVQQALAAGFDAHLSKPIGVRDLIDAILRVAKARAGNGPAVTPLPARAPGGNVRRQRHRRQRRIRQPPADGRLTRGRRRRADRGARYASAGLRWICRSSIGRLSSPATMPSAIEMYQTTS